MASPDDNSLTADGLKAGDVLKGTYRIVRFLGEGGAGAVYAGEHIGLGNPLAIKTLFGKFVRDEPMRRRFVEEGVIQANLNHPNIVRVTDIVNEPQLCAIIMEYIEGSSLDRFLQKAPQPPDIGRMTKIFLQILDGMGHAHAQGIVHRDLKPANILLAGTIAEPQPKIADFGIAKVVSDFTRTETGTAMGTIYYASPEQLTNAKAVDHRADVYSLACTFFEMLTGQLPFTGDSLYGIMRSHVQAPRPDAALLNPNIPRALANVIKRAMAIEPDGRPQSCDAFAIEIRQAIASTSGALDFGNAPSVAPRVQPQVAAVTTPPSATGTSEIPGARQRTAPVSALAAENHGKPRASTPSRATNATRADTTAPARPGRGNQNAATLSTRANLGAEAPAHTATLVVRGAIVGLSVALLVLIVFAATRGGGSAEEAVVSTPTLGGAAQTQPLQTPPTTQTPVVAAPEADAQTPPIAEPIEAERFEFCRDLVNKHVHFDMFGDIPIGQAIVELDRNHASCEDVFLARAGVVFFDRLSAQLNGDQMRIVLHDLSAMRARGTVGGDECTESQLAATEAQRSLRRVFDASATGQLMDYEVLSLATRRQFALDRHGGLTERHPNCSISPLPAELLPVVEKPEGAADPALNPQIVNVEVLPGAPDLVAIPRQ